MKILMTICAVVILVLAIGSPASAVLTWQTTPILGTGGSDVTGDLVMITGPTPQDEYGHNYYDVDRNLVLGPTIPHYNMAGDPLYQVGAPSMTTFVINPDTWDGSHWYDPDAEIHAGSGVNLDAGQEYTYQGVWSYLGPNGAYSFDGAYNAAYVAPANFIMLHLWIYDLWLEDIGNWNYTETWTNNANPEDTITFSQNFTVVPEPVTIALFSLGSLVLLRRKR